MMMMMMFITYDDDTARRQWVGEGTDPDFVLAGRRGGGRDERGEACPSLMSSQRDPCALATQVSHLERKQ